VTGSEPVLKITTVYSPDSPGLTSIEFGDTFRLMLPSAATVGAIRGKTENIIRITRNIAPRCAERWVFSRGFMNPRGRLSIKSLSFVVHEKIRKI
jgi:hypothetical protein